MDPALIKVKIPQHAKAGVIRLRAAAAHGGSIDYVFDVPRAPSPGSTPQDPRRRAARAALTPHPPTALVSGKTIIVGLPDRPERADSVDGISVTHAWLGGEPIQLPVVKSKPPVGLPKALGKGLSSKKILNGSQAGGLFVISARPAKGPAPHECEPDLLERVSMIVDATREIVASILTGEPPVQGAAAPSTQSSARDSSSLRRDS